MEYNKTSMKAVIGKVVRDLSLQDATMIPDIMEWMTEAMQDMQTRWTLQQTWYDAEVYFYKVELPCGMAILTAVEFEGRRLQARDVSRHTGLIPRVGDLETPGIWVSSVKKVRTPNGFYSYEQQTASIPNAVHEDHWFTEDGPGYIQVSMESGFVRLHMKEVAVDKQGYPLIVDQYDYKEALYWYTRKKMIESGWSDTVLNWDRCDHNYSVHVDRARAAIKYPSTARMETMMDHVMLIPPQNFFETYGNIEQAYEVPESKYTSQGPA